jgi:hypothetical protein
MKVLGILLIIVGAILGIYLGVWVMLIGGIIQFVHGLQADPVSAKDVAFGIARFVLAGVTGVLAFWICAIIGAVFLNVNED